MSEDQLSDDAKDYLLSLMFKTLDIAAEMEPYETIYDHLSDEEARVTRAFLWPAARQAAGLQEPPGQA